jgi:uncharacterized protein (DUF1800 family)
MNQHFKVAQKIGLMFRPETSLPNDIKSWAISQLQSNSPALGISSFSSKVEPWPQSLQPNLDERAELFRILQGNYKKNREIKNTEERGSKDHQNKIKHSMIKKDELKFAHRNVYGNDQIRLRLMSFWTNHFTIGDVFMNEGVIGHAMEEAILANLNGSFSEMLYKVTTHPGMLTYLDNNYSSGEHSKHYYRCKPKIDCEAGLNDNLGRELLELHTVSPNAGYTEVDIKETAKVLAGWGANQDASIKHLQGYGSTNHWDMFKTDYAEPGGKTVMGKTIYAGKGGLRQLTDFLASSEHTIMHISEKLCHHFVSDNPQKKDIDFIANSWRQSKGDLDQIHSAVIELVINSKEDKFQWPINWLFQVIRLSDATYFHGWNSVHSGGKKLMDVDKIFEELGQSFFSERQPNGYSSDKVEWLSGEMLERRLRFASAIHKTGRTKSSPEQIMDRIGANMTTRNLVKSAGSNSNDRFTALMCSPELMGLNIV